MRLGWDVHLFGPLYLSDTIWRSRRRPRGKVWHGTLPGWNCPHNHTREDTAVECARREQQRRRREMGAGRR